MGLHGRLAETGLSVCAVPSDKVSKRPTICAPGVVAGHGIAYQIDDGL